MKELAYPFDSAYIMKKKRSLKRNLLKDESSRLEKKIAVLGGSTTNDVISCLELFLLDNGIKPNFYQSEYGQYWQDALFGNEELDKFSPDVIYIHTGIRNIQPEISPKMTEREIEEAFQNEKQRFEVMWSALERKFHCPIIQNNFEMPFFRLMGNKEASDVHGVINFVTRLNTAFYEYAQKHNDFYINDINWLSAMYGLEKWSNPEYWYMYKYALDINAIPQLAYQICSIVKSLFGKNKKAVAVDLDNTMWGGVVGDDGVENLSIGKETAEAMAYYEFQKYIKSLKDIGVVLTVCSKNDEENALAGLSHPEGAVNPDDFAVIKANWEPKDKNISDTAKELDLLPESFVFVDDNPAEREIVREQLNGISVPELSSVSDYIKTIDRSEFFEVTNFSEDDLKRGEMYKANAKRESEKTKFESYEDYLHSLNMTAEIDDFKPVYIQRITQLANKSNQFNLTTRRYTLGEMETIFNSPDYVRLYGKLYDKFGDNGVVSVVIGKKKNDELHIELWIMSCRVLKRGLEYAMLDKLMENSVNAGIKKIYGYYYPTAKNKMVSELYDNFGFAKLSCDENGNSVWLLETENYKRKNKVINIVDNNK